MLQRLSSKLVRHNDQNLNDILGSLKGRDYISYKDYGAVLDGVTDDTDAIIRAHNAANELGLPVMQMGGTALVDLTKQIIIKTDTTFVGFRFKTSKMAGRGIVITTDDIINVDTTTLKTSEFIATRTAIPSLAGYENHHVVLSSSETDLNRKRDAGPALQLKAQPLIVGKGGSLNAPLWSTFGSFTEVKAQPLNIPTLTVQGLVLEVSGDIDKGNPIGVQRNNVRLIGCTFIDAVTSNTIPVQSLISVEFACNVLIEDTHLDALAKDHTTSYNYAINIWKSSNVTINRLTSFDGWAQVDGNYFRGLTVDNSTIDRVGGHFRCYDATFTNLSARRGRCIEISGGGNLKVENIKVQVSSGSDAGWVVGIRGDYGAEWDGNIDVSNVTVDATGLYRPVQNKQISVVSALIDSTVGGHDFQRQVVLPRSISVRDIQFRLNNMTSSTLRAVVVGCVSEIQSDILYPESIDVQNISATSLSNNVEYKIVGLHLLAGHKISSRRQHLEVSFEWVKNIDPKLYSKTVLDDNIGVIFYNILGSNLTTNTTVRNCPWATLRMSGSGSGTGQTLSFNGGSVSYLEGVSGNKLNFENVTFNGTRFRGAFAARIMDSVFADYIDNVGNHLRVGNGANIEDYVTAIKGTVTEVGQSITSTVITASAAWEGWKKTGVYQ